MPANLTPEYYKAERWFRDAATSDEKILALEHMLRVIPKHKGTDHLRADLRRKLSKLKETATGLILLNGKCKKKIAYWKVLNGFLKMKSQLIIANIMKIYLFLRKQTLLPGLHRIRP